MRTTVPLAVIGALALASNAAGRSIGDGVTWFVAGKPAPPIIQTTVGAVMGNQLNSVLNITARRRGPANEPLNGVWCVYRGRRGGGLKGGPPPFNDCSKLPGVDVCNMKPTTSVEPGSEAIGCLLPGSTTKACTYSFRLWTAWTDYQRDSSGQTMGYDIHRFTVVVKPSPASG
jgi:hypothetical protein